MALDSLEDLFIHEIKDLYSAETQLLDALPKVAAAVRHEELRDALNEHLEETREQVRRLEKIFSNFDENPQGEHCNAMEGLIEEAQELIEEEGKPNVKDAALIAAAQRTEHYEMAGYGAAKAYADSLGYSQASDLLSQTLNEEKAADKKLNKIATGSMFSDGVNKEARETA